MKRILFLSFLLGIFAFSQVEAQTTDIDKLKAKSEALKQKKKMLKQADGKVAKKYRKEAKELEAEGWKTSPGVPSLENQRQTLAEYTTLYYDEFYTDYGEAVAQTYNAAKLQAVTAAKNNLAGTISTEVGALIDAEIANQNLAADDAATVDKVKSASKQLIQANLGATKIIVEMFQRIESNKNYKVAVNVAYNKDTAMDMAKKAIKKELEKELGEQHEELDKILGW